METPPTGDNWLHEIKHDGFRTLVLVERGRARAFSRRGHDWSARYPRILAAAAELPCRSAIIDGEAVVQDAVGRSDLAAFHSALDAEPHGVLLFAFDLLHLDGHDLRREPLEKRRARLQALLKPDPLSGIQFSEAIEGDGRVIFAEAEKLGLEGIVSKRLGSRYKSGASRDWLKTKAMMEGEFVVVGAAPNPGGAPFALLAREEGGELVYAGSAFVTLPGASRDRFWRAIDATKVKRPVVAGIGSRKASFCRPDMRVRAKHLRGESMPRHPSLTALL